MTTPNESVDKNLYDSLSEEREDAPMQAEPKEREKEGKGKKVVEQEKKSDGSSGEWRSAPRKEDPDSKLGAGWVHKERKSSRKMKPAKEREKSPFEYTKQALLSFHQPNPVPPSDFTMIPNICSEESLAPVNESPHLLKQVFVLPAYFKRTLISFFQFSLRFYNKNTRTVFHQWLEGVGAGEEVCSFVWRILFNLTKYQQDEEEALILVGNQMNVSDRIFSC